MKEALSRSDQRILLFSVFVLSLCGIIYELILGSLATQFLGNPLLQYSVTIGVFLFSMGIGSFLSRFFVRDLIATFVRLEIVLGMIGGLSVLILNYFYLQYIKSPDDRTVSMYLLQIFFLVIIGVLVGLEIPLLTRILKKSGVLKDILASVLSLDYLGGLAGSLLFPLVLFPEAGRVLSSIIIGICNILVSVLVLVKVGYPNKRKSDLTLALILAVILMVLAIHTKRIESILDSKPFDDTMVYIKRSRYQEIVLTRNENDFRLYLNGSLQFSSIDEYRYHEMLVYPPMLLCETQLKQVLVLGGGDGLAVRTILSLDNVSSVTLVELDRAMIDCATKIPSIVAINNNSLRDGRVHVVIDDAYTFLIANKKKFDVIIADFPDPHDESTAKLYSLEFFGLVRRSLNKKGIFVTQSTSPFFAAKAFWCINETMKRVFPWVVPYHAYVPTFGDWGFNMASMNRVDVDTMGDAPGGARFFSRETFKASLHFSDDVRESGIDVNTFNRPVIYSYYLKGWRVSVD